MVFVTRSSQALADIIDVLTSDHDGTIEVGGVVDDLILKAPDSVWMPLRPRWTLLNPTQVQLRWKQVYTITADPAAV